MLESSRVVLFKWANKRIPPKLDGSSLKKSRIPGRQNKFINIEQFYVET
jgi:hypothetical protein